MNYRHAYHAGNFADVVKHIVFALCIAHLKKKDAPFRVLDTHAGIGRYRLDLGEAAKTGEWRNGIGRLIGPGLPAISGPDATILGPYLDAVRALNAGDALTLYPGSPLLAQALLRSGDRLVLNELHPEDGRALAKNLGRDRRIKVMALDGWIALKSLLPPRERRGVVLVDPPFEEPGELIRMTEGLRGGLERFETGTYLLWYPIKDPKPVARFHRALAEFATTPMLRVELLLRPARNPQLLNGAGLVIVNPPFTLAADLAAINPLLCDRLVADEAGDLRVDWIEPKGGP